MAPNLETTRGSLEIGHNSLSLCSADTLKPQSREKLNSQFVAEGSPIFLFPFFFGPEPAAPRVGAQQRWFPVRV